MQLNVKKYPIDAALSVSFAVHRANSGYVKNTIKAEDGVYTWSNKEAVAYTLSARERDAGYNKHSWIHPEFTPVAVDQQDVENVELAKNHVKRYMMGLISGKITAFQKDVFDIFSEDHVPANKIALLSYVPELMLREISEKTRNKQIKEEYQNSMHYTSTVSGICEILKSFYMKTAECYVYVCGIDGNLVSFTNSRKIEVGTQHRITGKVKTKDYCKDTGLPQTRLHYVKFKKNDKINKTV
jgi:hypothetical protein